MPAPTGPSPPTPSPAASLSGAGAPAQRAAPLLLLLLLLLLTLLLLPLPPPLCCPAARRGAGPALYTCAPRCCCRRRQSRLRQCRGVTKGGQAHSSKQSTQSALETLHETGSLVGAASRPCTQHRGCSVVPCPALPCPALPCPALPCPACHRASSPPLPAQGGSRQPASGGGKLRD